MLLRDVDADCTVVGVPGRVIHQSGVRIRRHPLCLHLRQKWDSIRKFNGNNCLGPKISCYSTYIKTNPYSLIKLPDAEAQVIRNLMERIDALENALALARGGQAPAANKRKACGTGKNFHSL